MQVRTVEQEEAWARRAALLSIPTRPPHSPARKAYRRPAHKQKEVFLPLPPPAVLKLPPAFVPSPSMRDIVREMPAVCSVHIDTYAERQKTTVQRLETCLAQFGKEEQSEP